MVTLVIHQRVRDYATWKAVFDAQEGVRRSHGEVEHRIYRFPGDANGVVIHNDFPSGEAARGFLEDPSLEDARARGGVEGNPGTGFLALVEQRVYADAQRASSITLVIHHRVSDYAAWKPVFDAHEGVRRSHGAIEHRLYQDPYDLNRLVIHNDFPTEEAARGFLDDPSLSEAMRRGGVVGEPGTGTAMLAERKIYEASPVA